MCVQCVADVNMCSNCLGKDSIFGVEWEVSNRYVRTSALSAAGSMLHGSLVAVSMHMRSWTSSSGITACHIIAVGLHSVASPC